MNSTASDLLGPEDFEHELKGRREGKKQISYILGLYCIHMHQPQTFSGYWYCRLTSLDDVAKKKQRTMGVHFSISHSSSMPGRIVETWDLAFYSLFLYSLFITVTRLQASPTEQWQLYLCKLILSKFNHLGY
jgi:hypothetical protein